MKDTYCWSKIHRTMFSFCNGPSSAPKLKIRCKLSKTDSRLGYLGGVGEYADRQKYPLPCLVLLDLKLPYVPGFDVLKWIRSRTELQTLPVIILTSSSERSDLDRAYRLGANSFMVKPSDAEQLLGLAKSFSEYWLKYNLLPPIG